MTRPGALLLLALGCLVLRASAQGTVGSCGLDAAPGVRWTGQVFEFWAPVKGAGIFAFHTWSHGGIPDADQGIVTPNYAECNCRCAGLDQCGGYVWLGGDYKQCWLLTFADYGYPPKPFFNEPQTDTPFPVPADTVVARAINGTKWRPCGANETIVYTNATYSVFDKSGITSQAPANAFISKEECNTLCGQDPKCVAYSLDGDPNAQPVHCTLYSNATGGLVPSSFGTAAFVAPLQTCIGTFASPPPAALPPAPPTPPAPTILGDGGTCKVPAGQGVRALGKVPAGWVPVRNVGNPDSDAFSHRGIATPDQALTMNTPAECNCKCRSVAQCVGYVWRADTTECWLLSFMRWYRDPVAGYSDPNSPGVTVPIHPDTVLARVIRYPNPGSVVLTSKDWCDKQGLVADERKRPATYSSERIRYQPQGTNWTVYDCNNFCMIDPYCIAYSWQSLDPKGLDASPCTLYSEASGDTVADVRNDTIVWTAPLQTCKPDIGTPFIPAPAPAPPPTGSGISQACGIDPTPGQKYTGKVWGGWVPVVGYGDTTLIDDQAIVASNRFIPDTLQGTLTANASACNCLCAGVTTCIGYTWLGAQRQECWLHSMVRWEREPSDTFADPLTPPGAPPSPVPADAVLGRVERGAQGAYRLCRILQYSPDNVFVTADSAAITNKVNLAITPLQCNMECAKDPACVGFSWTTTVLDTGDPHTCTLYSSVSGGMRSQAPQGTLRTCVARLQACVHDDELMPPAPPPFPGAPPVPAPSNGDCVADPSAGVRAKGKVWPGWQPAITGWTLDQAAVGPAFSNRYFPPEQQGQPSPTPADCNCKCSKTTACVGYTWLPDASGQAGTCWLQSYVQFYTDPVTTYQDPASGNTLDVPAGTVIGRVITNADWPFCNIVPNDLVVHEKQAPVVATTTGITRTFQPPVTLAWQACNQECGRDPQCVAFTYKAPTRDDVAQCRLLSQVSGGLAFNSSKEGIWYTAPLQTCLSAHPPALIGPLGGPGAANPSASGSKSLSGGTIGGIVAGGVAAIVLLAAVALFVLWRRRSRDHPDSDAMSWRSPSSLWSPKGGQAKSKAGDTTHTDSLWSLGHPEAAAAAKHTPMEIPGLAKGEIFTRATAFEYTWLKEPLDPEQVVAVEAGVNDRELDAMLKKPGAVEGSLPPVVELSKDELRKQVKLVEGGLLGRGATAIVFQCVWPERFGPNSLLAAKVLKDGHEVDPLVLQSFAYEANVLASTEHPCVIRLYGYCLEPPCVCIILELLSYSLKDLLYGVKDPSESTLRPYKIRSGRTNLSETTKMTNSSANSQDPLLPVVVYHDSNASSPWYSTAVTLPASGAEKSMIMVTPNASAVLAREGSSKANGGTSPTASPDAAARANGSGSPEAASATVIVKGEGDVEKGTFKSAAPPQLEVDLMSSNSFVRGSPTEKSFTGTALTSSGSRGSGAVAIPTPSNKASPLTMAQVLRISTDIAAGLAYLHDRPLLAPGSQCGHEVLTLSHSHGFNGMEGQGTKIVHRDLKPANILINSLGRAKISDFGLARQTQRTTLHTERLGAGTLPYMAPELLSGAHAGAYKMAPTNRVDIYSLSMMMWEMISGRQPWSDKNEVAIMAAVIRSQRPDLPPATKDAPEPGATDITTVSASLRALPDFNAIIRACWNQRELKRPTAVAVYGMLTDLLRKYGQEVPTDLFVPPAIDMASPGSYAWDTSRSSGSNVIRWPSGHSARAESGRMSGTGLGLTSTNGVQQPTLEVMVETPGDL